MLNNFVHRSFPHLMPHTVLSAMTHYIRRSQLHTRLTHANLKEETEAHINVNKSTFCLNNSQSFAMKSIFMWVGWVLQWSLPSLHHTWCHLEPGCDLSCCELRWRLCMCDWMCCSDRRFHCCTATFHTLHPYDKTRVCVLNWVWM